jgi:hypothetical protein
MAKGNIPREAEEEKHAAEQTSRARDSEMVEFSTLSLEGRSQT